MPDDQQPPQPDPPPSYRRAFWKSAPHAWLAALTLGIGFATGSGIGLLIGAACYALGLVYLPDTAWFHRRIDAKNENARLAGEKNTAAAFQQKCAQLINSLTDDRIQKYNTLVRVCKDITDSTADNTSGDLALSLDTRLRKLDELIWTYLRLLAIGQSLETYLETERRENLPAAADFAKTEIATLEADLAAMPASAADTPAVETRKKLLASRRERLLAIEQRLDRVTQARANFELTRSEQERLVEQAKLIRADAIASKNAGVLGTRIDLSIEHLTETNHWLNEMADFKDLTAQLPPMRPGSMVESAAATPPPLPSARRKTTN